MVIFKVRKSWRNVGAMPLLRALVVDGAVYYCVFVFAFSLEIVANLSEEVRVHDLSFLTGPYSSDIALLSLSGYRVCTVVLLSHLC